MYIFAQGDFLPGSGSLQVITLQWGQSPRGATSAGKPVPCRHPGQVQGFSPSQVFSHPLGWGWWGVKVLISEAAGLPYSRIWCPEL